MKAIKLNLLKFKNACVLKIQGKTGKKACLVIPIEDAHLVAGEKGVYADLLEWMQKPAGQDIRTRERQRMAGLLAKKIKRKIKGNEDTGDEGDPDRGREAGVQQGVGGVLRTLPA